MSGWKQYVNIIQEKEFLNYAGKKTNKVMRGSLNRK